MGEPSSYANSTFDDPTVLAVATEDPAGFVADLPERVILDEVQKVTRLFPTLKLSVDRNRKPGRFLLTGSSRPASGCRAAGAWAWNWRSGS